MSKAGSEENAMTLKRLNVLYVAALGLACALGLTPRVQAQDAPQHWPSAMHDDVVLTKIMIDRLERRDANPDDFTYWEGQAWVGGDVNKLWLKSEGSRVHGKAEDASLEAYYSRAVAAFWDAQFGVRHDFAAGDAPARNWLGFGFKGLAPYVFDVDATAYLGGSGRSAARLKAEYNLLLTQRLILMPEVEFNAYGKEDPERGLGSGLAESDVALRLRYDIRREFAPYIGVVWTHKYGATADFARVAGGPVHDTQYVAGVRAWW